MSKFKDDNHKSKMHARFNDTFAQADIDRDGFLDENEYKTFYLVNLEKTQQEYGDAPPASDEVRETEWKAYSQMAANPDRGICKDDFNIFWKAWGNAMGFNMEEDDEEDDAAEGNPMKQSKGTIKENTGGFSRANFRRETSRGKN